MDLLITSIIYLYLKGERLRHLMLLSTAVQDKSVLVRPVRRRLHRPACQKTEHAATARPRILLVPNRPRTCSFQSRNICLGTSGLETVPSRSGSWWICVGEMSGIEPVGKVLEYTCIRRRGNQSKIPRSADSLRSTRANCFGSGMSTVLLKVQGCF